MGTAVFDLHALAPELILTGVAILVLVYDLFIGDERKWTIPIVAAGGILAAGIPLVTLALNDTARSLFGGAYVVDGFALVLKGIFLGASFVVLLMSAQHVEEGDYHRGEFYFLLLSALLGMLVISSARDMITLFVAIELVSSPTYLLAGWRKRDLKSNEAALKYFLLGVVSIAISLYGMSILFGVTGGALKFTEIASWMSSVPSGSAMGVAAMSIVLILVGFAFKIAAVPFHLWAPDTYEGAPLPVTAFLSVASKTAGFVGLFTLVYLAFPAQSQVWRPVIYGLAIATMTVGNLIAIKQTNLVRMLAYSSIAQAGYVLVPFAATTRDGRLTADTFASSVTYLLIYAVMNLGAFAVIIAVARRTRSVEISTWTGLSKYAGPGGSHDFLSPFACRDSTDCRHVGQGIRLQISDKRRRAGKRRTRGDHGYQLGNSGLLLPGSREEDVLRPRSRRRYRGDSRTCFVGGRNWDHGRHHLCPLCDSGHRSPPWIRGFVSLTR